MPRDWVWPLGFCLAAFAVRAGVYLAAPGAVHPDETFQYIEQGHRLLGNPGLVPWEYVAGLRNWVLPAVVAAALWLAGLLELDPVGRVQAVSVVFAAWSASTIWAAYRWAGQHGGPAAAIAGAGLGIASIDMAHIGPHPLNETLATPLLVWGLFLADAGAAPHRARSLAAGLLLGACVFLRVQLAPAAAVGALLLARRDPGGRGLSLALGGGAALLGGGVLDWVTLGTPLQSIWLYVQLNIAHGVAAHFGVSPWYQYPVWLHYTWGPLFVPIIALALLGAWRAPGLAAVAAAIVLPLSVIGHKEPRFAYPAMPFAMVLVALGSVRAAEAMLRRWHRARMPPRALGAIVAAAWLGAAASVAALSPAWPRWSAYVANGMAMRQVNADPAACGLAVAPPAFWSAATGYAYLRAGIPLYAAEPAGPAGQFAAFNYILAPVGLDLRPAGYAARSCWDDARPAAICLWRRDGGCLADDAATGATPLTLPAGIPGRGTGR